MKIKMMLLAFAASLLLSSCGKPDNKPDIPDNLSNEAVISSENVSGTPSSTGSESENEDLNATVLSEIKFPETCTSGSYDKKVTATVFLSDSEIKVSGSNVSVSGSAVTVTNSGTYVFSGKLSNGQIVVDSVGVEKVSIVLNGVDISSSTTAAINILQSEDKVELKIAKIPLI